MSGGTVDEDRQRSGPRSKPGLQKGVFLGGDNVRTKDTVTMLRTIGQVIKHRHPSIDPKRLGARSVRSGAAMALFIKGHHPERIKILGRWKSEAFLIYIRPQVLEWTNLMARDMASSKPNAPRISHWQQAPIREKGTMPPLL